MQTILVTKKAGLAKGSALTKAVRLAHAATKGSMVYVLCDVESEGAEPIVEFFDIQPDSPLPKARPTPKPCNRDQL